MERFARQVADALNRVLDIEGFVPITPLEIEVPPDPNLGDFAFPCFKLAKLHKKSPAALAAQVAQDLISKNAVPPGFQVAPAGPYVNFLAKPETLRNTILTDIVAGDDLGQYGSLADRKRETWVLEFSSPNVAKPFMIYHLRPTVLGAALDRIGRFRGLNIVSINHLGDWGTQYGKLAVAFRLYGSDLPAEPTIEDMVQIYVKFHAEAETNPELEQEARDAFARLEKNDPQMIANWKKCVEIAMAEFTRIYARLGVHFDHIWGESFYRTQLEPLLELLRAKGLLEESEGAWVVKVETRDGKELPPCILQKSDGATIYATRDVAAAIYRYEQFKFDRMTYIVGQEQKLHFQQVFGVLSKMGYPWAKALEHVPFGLYRFKDAKMSTRKGNFVTLNEVLELAKTRVRELISTRKRDETWTTQEFEDVVEKVALGAVVFHDLHSDPVRDVEFDLENVVNFEGETGPYVQYAHTRCLSILRKAQEAGKGFIFDEKALHRIDKPEELALIRTLGQLSTHLERTLAFSKASQLAHYMVDIVKAFGLFYRECQVLTEDAELTKARLMLVEATRRVLARGLGLLGVPTPNRM